MKQVLDILLHLYMCALKRSVSAFSLDRPFLLT